MIAHAVDVDVNKEISKEDSDKMLNLHFNKTFICMREYASINNVPIINDEGLAFLETLIRVKRPSKILEIGTAIGYSASRMSLICDSEVVTIERDVKMYNQALINIKELKLENKVKIIFKDALHSFDDVKNEKFDMIFIDAAKGQYTNFFNLYENLLSENGIIVTDNMLFHGLVMDENDIKSRSLRGLVRKLNKYHEFLLNHESYHTTIFNIGDGISVSTKK